VSVWFVVAIILHEGDKYLHVATGIVTEHQELCSLQRIHPPRLRPAPVVANHHSEDRIALANGDFVFSGGVLLDSIRHQTWRAESLESQVSRREIPFLQLVDCFRVFKGLDSPGQMDLAVLADHLVFTRRIVDAGVIARSSRSAFGITENDIDPQTFCFGEEGRDVGRLCYVFAVCEEGI